MKLYLSKILTMKVNWVMVHSYIRSPTIFFPLYYQLFQFSYNLFSRRFLIRTLKTCCINSMTLWSELLSKPQNKNRDHAGCSNCHQFSFLRALLFANKFSFLWEVSTSCNRTWLYLLSWYIVKALINFMLSIELKINMLELKFRKERFIECSSCGQS